MHALDAESAAAGSTAGEGIAGEDTSGEDTVEIAPAPLAPAAPAAVAADTARTGTPAAPRKSAADVPVALAEPGMTGILGQDQVHRTWPAGTARTVLQADPQLLWWARRAVVLVSVGAVMTFLTDWQIGLPVAVVAATADMLCHSRTRAVIPPAARVTSAQRQTRRRLARTAPSGYISIHKRMIPGTPAVVDHLVIGPAGVYAVNSQRWDRRLPVSATQSGQLYHGPFDQSGDLGHARWQAGQVSRLVGDALGQPIAVRAAMVIYGPTVPWVVTDSSRVTCPARGGGPFLATHHDHEMERRPDGGGPR
jgi:hypothetical protein